MLGGLWQAEDEEEEVAGVSEAESHHDEEGADEDSGLFGSWLPEEVAVRIFCWLPPEDLARAEAVCRQWHSILCLSVASSSLTPWLWRKVHERHFGGPVPATKKHSAHDHRTFCLYSARLLHKYQRNPDSVHVMLTWAVNCGHHAALARILATNPAAVQALPKRADVLPGAIATNDERVVELVCRHGALVDPHMIVAAVRRGSLAIVGVLLRFLPAAAAPATDGGQASTPLDHLEALLRGIYTSPTNLWHLASKGSHVSLMEHLLKLHREHSADRYRELLLSYDQARGYNALQNACYQNDRRVFDFLVKDHMSDELLNAPTSTYRTRLSALLLAVKHADIELVRRLLELGARESGFDMSPLHAACAAEASREERMTLFIERGADVNELTKSGRGCLHIVCGSSRTSVEAVRLLLAKGADARLLSRGGRSALELVLTSAPKQPDELAQKLAIGDLLLAHGCPSALRHTVLVVHWLGRSADQERYEQAERWVYETLQWLWARAGWPSLEGATDTNALLPLVGISSPRIMVLMAANGLDVASHMVLEGLLRRGPPYILETNLKALIGLGLDINMRNPQTGLPPIHSFDLRHVPLLVRHGADVNAVNAQGRTLLENVVSGGVWPAGVRASMWLGCTLSRSHMQATLQRLGVDRWDEDAPSDLWVAGAEERRKWRLVAQALATILQEQS